ncbi:MAG: hypothetical protein WCL71_05295, partial [Deltaproteobacteria bacterium]
MQTRAIIDLVDWDCDLRTFFRERNSGGAGLGVSAALNWFFESVEEGIILEYDCVPDPDFFLYCRELLSRYRDNARIMFISGNNFQDGNKRGDSSYFFSPLTHNWGWATWRSVWKRYEFDLRKIRKALFYSALSQYNKDKEIIRYWKMIFMMMRMGRIDTWDYQLMFSIWMNNGLAIVPNVNLVTHLVLENGESGTFFTSHMEGITNIQTHPIMPLRHPREIRQNEEAYQYH